jgi:hypothetical protein
LWKRWSRRTFCIVEIEVCVVYVKFLRGRLAHVPYPSALGAFATSFQSDIATAIPLRKTAPVRSLRELFERTGPKSGTHPYSTIPSIQGSPWVLISSEMRSLRLPIERSQLSAYSVTSCGPRRSRSPPWRRWRPMISPELFERQLSAKIAKSSRPRLPFGLAIAISTLEIRPIPPQRISPHSLRPSL